MKVFGGGSTYVDRGDPAAVDFAVGDLTTNGAWHDLDLSSIVPAGAKSVILYVAMRDTAADVIVIFRKNGNSNSINVGGVANEDSHATSQRGDIIVALDSNRVIEYFTTNTSIDTLNITVKGWFI